MATRIDDRSEATVDHHSDRKSTDRVRRDYRPGGTYDAKPTTFGVVRRTLTGFSEARPGPGNSGVTDSPAAVRTRNPLFLPFALIGLSGAIFGVLAKRSERVARTWNRRSPLANGGLRIGHKTYLLHAPHRLRLPGHQSSWHWESKLGPLPLSHHRFPRPWNRFF
jgi:hypothetical protein